MRSLSNLGLALSLIFGCLLLALFAELYYLLLWKKKRIITNNRGIEVEEDEFRRSPSAREFLYMFCWKSTPPTSLSARVLNPRVLAQVDSGKNSWLRTLREKEERLEAELIRIQILSAPPNPLSSIKEETKEDLESDEDGKSTRNDETPFFTPLASPPYFTPPLTPVEYHSTYYNYNQGFNPLFGSPTEEAEELSRMRWSPPPKFKFLKDAEEKFKRGEELREEVVDEVDGSVEEEGDGSFITLIVGREREVKNHHPNHSNLPKCHSSSSQVLPLPSSPSNIQAKN
ncbi:hypothetical protein U1Q18_026146 [Sarracenia purpurea var. burkii]